MLSEQKQFRLFRQFALFWMVVLPVLFYAFFLGGREWLSANLFTASNQTLTLYVSSLNELISKYKPLPYIYAQHPLVKGILQDPKNDLLRHKTNVLLKQFNEASKASDTYVLDVHGLTISASNYDRPKTFVGRSFNFRPYFKDALLRGSGQFFALGTTSLQRGYYLSHAIKDDKGAVIGVMAVKIDVSKIEQGWQASDHEVMVTDRAGIVFLSSRPGWLYNALKNPSPNALTELGRTKRYADKRIGRLPFDITPVSLPWRNLFMSRDVNHFRYLATFQDIPTARWRVWILANQLTVRNTAIVYATVIVLIITMGAIAIVSFIDRRRGLLRALNVQQKARKTLENSSIELEHQVEKRTKDLKQAQNELVQAGKMAALGQMSVGINHELNQPLTAIRSYADNAGKFLNHGRIDEAKENLTLIAALSERMGDIILRLKIFARESSEQRTQQVLQNVIRDTKRVVNPRLKKDKVTLDVQVPAQDIFVMVNDVRLEQVLVNLINNAIDALDGNSERKIELIVHANDNNAIVTVRDFGPGIPVNVIDHLFEPFFTTKEIGIGLGLGLSISHGIIQELGGELSAKNLSDGGAAFSFNIPLTFENASAQPEAK